MTLRARPPILRSRFLLALLLAVACAAVPAADAGRSEDSAEADASTPRPIDAREQNRWFAAGRARVAEIRRRSPNSQRAVGFRRAKNVILFVGDGMGISTVTAARIFQGQERGETGEENLLAFEKLPHLALSKTYNTDTQVADSASTMTAMVSGVKTQAGVLGVDESIRRGDFTSVEGAKVLTILEEAEDRGLATGVVSTATVTHATPGGCYAHVPFRFWQNDSEMSDAAREADFPDIARQLVESPHGDGLEVALGGGRKHFTPADTADPERADDTGARVDGRDLTREWVERRDGSAYVWNHEQLRALDLDSTQRLLGLFEPGNMKFEADRAKDEAGEPSLAEMTRTALGILGRDPDGFFLMVEGGRIDHGHHAGNAYRALVDTLAFSDAVDVALETVDLDETLVVVTADHSHTLVISGYPQRGNPILGKVVGLDWKTGATNQISRDANGRPYTTLSYANGPGHVDGKKRPDLEDVDTTDPEYKQEATVPLRSETHAGEDVPIYAGGPGAELFQGVREQNYIYHAMVEAFGWTREGVPIAR